MKLAFLYVIKFLTLYTINKAQDDYGNVICSEGFEMFEGKYCFKLFPYIKQSLTAAFIIMFSVENQEKP